MAKSNKDLILDYYQRELQYLRKQGAEFAKHYPKIAKRLELSETEVADPHVERLIESFAYLTGKIQKELDDQFPQLASALLHSLYPQFSNPVPPSTIICFDMGKFRGALMEGTIVPRHTQIFSTAQDDTECFFQTAYPVELWPIEISSIELTRRENTLLKSSEMSKQRILKIRLNTLATPLYQLPISRLRFYIHAERNRQDRLYELLFKESAPVVTEYKQDDDKVVRKILPPQSLKSVGYYDEESAFPFPENAHAAYRLLFEYFHFPQKFYFFDIENLSMEGAQEYLDIYIGMPESVLFDIKNLDDQVFRLGCTPAVNLFSKTSEPLLFDHRASEYRLLADVRREKTTEIHSIEGVYALNEGDEQPSPIHSYYSYQHKNMSVSTPYYWVAKRRALLQRSYEGYDIYLSFVDEDFNPEIPRYPTVYADLLCTNRHLAQYIASGTEFQCPIEQPAPHIYALFKPTPTIYPPQEGGSLWRLIAHLSVNHLGLSQDPLSLSALKEILRLYAYTDETELLPELEAMVSLNTKTIVRRSRQEAWRGFVHGTLVDITVKDQASQKSLFLFMSILQRFLTAFASVNSFAELWVRRERKGDIWHQWEPKVGEIRLL